MLNYIEGSYAILSIISTILSVIAVTLSTWILYKQYKLKHDPVIQISAWPSPERTYFTIMQNLLLNAVSLGYDVVLTNPSSEVPIVIVDIKEKFILNTCSYEAIMYFSSPIPLRGQDVPEIRSLPYVLPPTSFAHLRRDLHPTQLGEIKEYYRRYKTPIKLMLEIYYQVSGKVKVKRQYVPVSVGLKISEQ